MNFTERIIKAANILTNGAIERTFLEAAVGTGEEPDAYKFRKLSNGIRDLNPMEYSKAAEMAFYLWQRNPLAFRIIEIMVDFCIGEEFNVELTVKKTDENGKEIRVENNNPQKVWDSFCNDPVNNFYEHFPLFAQELFLFGELLMPAGVNDVNGDVRLGFVDSKMIDEISKDTTGLRIGKVKIGEGTTKKSFDIINVDLDTSSATYGKRTGNAFFFRANRVLSQNRGHSELIQSLDWIDALDQFLFNSLEGNALRNAFFYDVTMEGAKEDEINKTKVLPPKPGSVKVHNDKVKWNVLTPDLKAADTAEATRLYKNFILAGKGYPEHWFAEGGNTNLATAEQMAIPTMRMLKRKQNLIKTMAKEIALFVIDQKLIKNPEMLGLKEHESVDVCVHAFDFNRDDSAVVASAFVQSMTALVTAATNGWVSDDHAKKVVDGNLKRLGIEVDESITVETIKKEKDNLQ